MAKQVFGFKALEGTTRAEKRSAAIVVCTAGEAPQALASGVRHGGAPTHSIDKRDEASAGSATGWEK